MSFQRFAVELSRSGVGRLREQGDMPWDHVARKARRELVQEVVSWTDELATVALGQRFDIWVELPPRQASVLVPRSAVHVLDGRTFVQTPARIGSSDVDVELIAQDDSWVEVAGLAAGSRVLIEPRATVPTDGLATVTPVP